MAKNVRLVAYRKGAGSGAANTSDQFQTFELDLREFPNISVNYQFSDIKEPESRKGNYSQTFKLPFTDNNNKFFENWFNVNIETQYFDTREKYPATLFVGTIPQIDGFIQLKGVYKKGQYYEVAVFSNTADLFSVIGESRLKDVFLNVNGSYSNELNHTYNSANIKLSWDGSSAAFQNTAGTSLRDSVAGVQKVMYPMSISSPDFLWCDLNGNNSCDKAFLRMSEANSSVFNTPQDYRVPIEQFKPALQIKNMVKLILAKAGFSYTSNFIDGAYFGKLFMTTCGHLGALEPPVLGSTGVLGGMMQLGVAFPGSDWGELPDGISCGSCNEDCFYWEDFVGPGGFDLINDPSAVYDSATNTITRKFGTMNQMYVKHSMRTASLDDCDGGGNVNFEVAIVKVNDDGTLGDTLWSDTDFIFPSGYGTKVHIIPIDDSIMPVGTTFKIRLRRYDFNIAGFGAEFTFGQAYNVDDMLTTTGAEENVTTLVRIYWDPYDVSAYGQEVDVPSCIDPEALQKDLLKDLIERFNLLVISDPNNPSNIIIEPYKDYIGQGQVKYWTDKIDLDKEIKIKDTTSLQKKRVFLTDKEDVDMFNKLIKDDFPKDSVYGKKERIEIENQFASGELKNTPFFAPYMNSIVRQNSGAYTNTAIPNMTVQYEYSYSQNSNGSYTNSIKPTKPKMYYYCGTPTTPLDIGDNAITYYMHEINFANAALTFHSFTTYPVCSPFDITPSSNVYTLSESTNSLYWDGQAPLCGDLTIFNWNLNTSWQKNSLYHKYWEPYINEIFHPQARLMECYLNLNEVDIHNFKFNDEIYIKDSYWRILNIHNYQVGENVSTKVTLIKIIDTLIMYTGCRYVLGNAADGTSTLMGYYVWCPEDDADCTPTINLATGDLSGLLTNPQCCMNAGGEVFWTNNVSASSNLYLCQANASSTPLPIRNNTDPNSIYILGASRGLGGAQMMGASNSFVRGSDTSKYSTGLLPSFPDDIVIKYSTSGPSTPKVYGENHRVVLTGNTEANTRSYAYIRGTADSDRIMLPTNSNTMIKAKCISTVIGGTSTTHVVGSTETVEYQTAFRNLNGITTQVGTAGGNFIRRLVEGVTAAATILYLDVNDEEIRFGIEDSQTDTYRTWTLNIDISVQRIANLGLPLGDDYALYQNTQLISLQSGANLLWN